MKQIATIEKVLNDAYAMVSVARQSACGHDCESCAGCGVSGTVMTVRAKNEIGAVPGDRVEVSSDTKSFMRIVAMVYVVPFSLFFLGYFLTSFLPESGRYAVAGIAFALGFVLAVLYDRRLRARGGFHFEITKVVMGRTVAQTLKL